MAFVTDHSMGDTDFLLGASKPKEYRRTWSSLISVPTKKVWDNRLIDQSSGMAVLTGDFEVS